MRAALLSLLLVLPASAQEVDVRRLPSNRSKGDPAAFLTFQKQAIGIYFAEARSRLEKAKERLEVMQEFSLNPHVLDASAETAIRRIERVEGMLAGAEEALGGIASRFPPDEEDLLGWTPYEARLKEARSLIRDSEGAVEVAGLFEKGLKIELYPIQANVLGTYRNADRVIRIRGYYGVNDISPEYLAALLVHEGMHAVNHTKRDAGAKMTRVEDEKEARIAEVAFWRSLPEDRRRDWQSSMAYVLDVYDAGEAVFADWVASMVDVEDPWSWVEPEVEVPDAAKAPPRRKLVALARRLGIEDPAAAAAHVQEVIDLEAKSVAGQRKGALAAIDAARSALGALPELMAPQEDIVSHTIMTMEAGDKEYPLAMRLAHGTVTDLLVELDKAREVLGAGTASGAEVERLRRDQRREPKVSEHPGLAVVFYEMMLSTPTGRPLAEAFMAKGMRVGLYPWSDPGLEKEYPSRVLVPGRKVFRDPDDALALSWTAHVAAHRAQGVGPGETPTLAQETEAMAAVWLMRQLIGSDKFKGGSRFLGAMAAWEEGGDDYGRLYLKAKHGELFPEKAPAKDPDEESGRVYRVPKIK